MSHRNLLAFAALLALLFGAPALAEDSPASDPPPPPPPPAAESPAVEVQPPPLPPQSEAFRAERIDAASVIEINQLLRGRCFGPGYAARFTLVVEDEDADDLELRAHGPQSSGRRELYELEFDAGNEQAEIDFLGEDDEDDIGLDEDEPLQVTLLWKDGTLTLREGDDDVFDVEPDKDELEGIDCHVLSWEVDEEFYITNLEIQPIGKR